MIERLHCCVFARLYKNLRMRRTVFNTPVVKEFFKLVSWLFLKLAGWRVEGGPPDAKKYVLIAAPHTSNWDFPYTIAVSFCLGIKVYWMGKESLFRGPMGPIMHWFGGISVDRSQSNGLVQQIIDEYNRADELVVTIPPEGTRSKAQKWKSGFYHVADGANVPIVLGFMDYKRKVGGLNKLFMPTGDYDKDLKEIQAFYKNVTGRNPQQFG